MSAALKLETPIVEPDRGWAPQPRQEAFLRSPVRERLFGGAAGGGKRLDLATPLPTPGGWTTVGAVREGDLLFDERGAVCSVLALHPIEEAATSYRLEFDDGAVIYADAEHLWKTFNAKELAQLTRRTDQARTKRRAGRASRSKGTRSPQFVAGLAERNRTVFRPSTREAPRGTVRTTAELAATLLTKQGRRNHAIPVADPLLCPTVELALDPYLLGLWLGDGTSRAGSLTTTDLDLLVPFERGGFRRSEPPPKPSTTYGFIGLRPVLRALGVLGNKHVPRAYLRGSREQRLALLQGLMDTDGTVCAGGGVEFTNTKLALVEAVHELLVSLGWKGRIIEGRAVLDGRDCGPKWDVKWTPSDHVFRLPRKRAAQKLATRRTTRFRYLVSCDPVEPMAMRCLTVSSPSGLFLAGRDMVPTHNTDALLIEALGGELVHNRHHRALLLRRAFVDLRSYVLPRSYDLYEPLGGRYVASDRTWVFPSGATVQLGAADKVEAIRKFAGAPYNLVAFDELTHFTEWQYGFMWSRNRSAQGLPCYMVASANPGGPGHDWVLNRWRYWLYPRGHHSYAGPFARPGKSLWLAPQGEGGERVVRPGTPKSVSRTFFPSRVADNRFLAGSEYEDALEQLPLLERLQLRDGDWMARPSSGKFFKREWWQRAAALPAGAVVRLRYWDLAGSDAEDTTSANAWTAGARMSAVRVGTGARGIPLLAIYVEHLVRGQWSPGVVDRMIEDTARDDLRLDPKTITFIERDPAQAGKAQAWFMKTAYASRGIDLRPVSPQGDKLHRARIPSGQVEAGNVFLVEGTGNWIPAFLEETSGFPDDGIPKDQVDSFTGGCFHLYRIAGGTGGLISSIKFNSRDEPKHIGDALPKPLGAGAPPVRPRARPPIKSRNTF